MQQQVALNPMNYVTSGCPSFGAQPPETAQWLNQGTTSGVYPAFRTVGHPRTVGAQKGVLGTGVGLPVLLFLVFLVLKLAKVIDWSWWWVTSPLWIGFAIGLVAVILMAIFGAGALALGR